MVRMFAGNWKLAVLVVLVVVSGWLVRRNLFGPAVSAIASPPAAPAGSGP